MSAKNFEFDRLVRDFGFDVSSCVVNNDAVNPSLENDQPEVSAFSDVLQSKIAKAVEASWWYRVRNEIIVRNLRRWDFVDTLRDIGAGTGAVAAALIAAGIEAIAVESSIGGAAIATQHGVVSIQGTL